MDVTLITSLATSVLLALILLMKSFWSEKGKNLATKQDIGYITKKVEEVKSLHTKEIEALKSELQTNVYQQNKITDLTITYLLDFQDCILTIIKSNLSKSYGEFVLDDLANKIYLHQQETEQLFTKANILYHKLIVFAVSNTTLSQSIVSLIANLFEAKKVYDKHKHYIKERVLIESEANPLTTKYRDAVKGTNSVVNEYQKEFSPIHTKVEIEYARFSEELIKFFRKKNMID